MIQLPFNVLICIQFLVVALHDWLNIPGLTHSKQVMATLGPTRMMVSTLINCIFPGLAAAYAFYYWNTANKPTFVLTYWLVYCAITVLGATMAWWIPYFRGANEKTKQLYSKMYAGTRHVLPPRGDNPRPNLLHLYFHALFLTTLILSILLWFRIT